MKSIEINSCNVSYMNGDAGRVEEYAGDFAKLSELSQGLQRPD